MHWGGDNCILSILFSLGQHGVEWRSRPGAEVAPPPFAGLTLSGEATSGGHRDSKCSLAVWPHSGPVWAHLLLVALALRMCVWL